jgi:OPT family oligopeptide transporter
VLNILVSNLAITATFTHLFCWNYNEIKSAWSFASPSNLRKIANPRSWNWAFWRHATDSRPKDTTDPHLKLMLAYKDAPDWWYGATFVIAVGLGFAACYLAESTLPWWGFTVSVLIAATNILFFGAQYAITAFLFNTQTLIQMIGGYMHPGRPVANMYFTLFGYNSVSQGQLLLRDLKLGQYVHLSPRCTFAMQIMGTVLGGLVSYFVMNSVTDSQRDILLDIDGTNVWSGQLRQSLPPVSCYADTPSSPAVQLPSRRLGRPRQQALLQRLALPVGDVGLHPRLLRAPAALLPPPPRAAHAPRLPQHGRHRVQCWHA